MLKIRRIKTDKFKTAAFWIEKRDNEYIACRTLVNALLGIASPSIMSRGQEALKRRMKRAEFERSSSDDGKTGIERACRGGT